MGARTGLYARAYSSILHHKKFVALDPAAIGLWTLGNAYCWDQFTDGMIPKAQVPRLVAVRPARAFSLADLLVKAGLWEVADRDTYRVHDWLEHNPPAADILARREAERQRQQERRMRGRTGVHTDVQPDVRTGGRTLPRGRGRGIYPPIAPHSQNGTDDPLPPTAGLCALADRQAGRRAGECALSFSCPRRAHCLATFHTPPPDPAPTPAG